MTTAAVQRPEGFIPTMFQRRLAYREMQAGLLNGADLQGQSQRNLQYRRLEAMIGRNPLLYVSRVGDSHVLASVQSANPTESHYDRAYVAILRRLEADRVILPGDELHEITSGSSGVSFAWMCRSLGYRAHVLAASELPAARRQEMVNLGATVVDSGPNYVNGSSDIQRSDIARLRSNGHDVSRIETHDYLVVTAQRGDHRVCFVNHSHLQATVDAFKAIPDQVASVLNGPKLDAVFSVLGNWTTTRAWAERFPELYPGIKIFGVEDARSPVYAAQLRPDLYAAPTAPSHGSPIPEDFTFGSSVAGVPLRFDDVGLLDDVSVVNADERDARMIDANLGKPIVESIGWSSAASLVAAEKFAREHPGTTSLVFYYDKSDRYWEPLIARPHANDEAVQERARITVRPQKAVDNVLQLPSSLIGLEAGGLGIAYTGWALS